MSWCRTFRPILENGLATALSLVVLSLSFATTAKGATIFFGPTPYLSASDIPLGFYAGGTPTSLEDFEDQILCCGITASGGGISSIVSNPSAVDSVDIDDGLIDGSGLAGESWWFSPSAEGLTFTFTSRPTAAGLVWTDGRVDAAVTFEAFGPSMVSLGTIGPFTLGDDNNFGGTAEDRFFGVQDLGGVQAITISSSSGAVEVDHVQFGVIPEPSSSALLGLGIAGLAVLRKRSSCAPQAEGSMGSAADPAFR